MKARQLRESETWLGPSLKFLVEPQGRVTDTHHPSAPCVPGTEVGATLTLLRPPSQASLQGRTRAQPPNSEQQLCLGVRPPLRAQDTHASSAADNFLRMC